MPTPLYIKLTGVEGEINQAQLGQLATAVAHSLMQDTEYNASFVCPRLASGIPPKDVRLLCL